jgi:hypothetical protein
MPLWLQIALAVLPTVVSVVSLITLLKYRTDRLEKEMGEQKGVDVERDKRIDLLKADFNSALMSLKMFTTEQNGINNMSGKTIEALLKKLEETNHQMRNLEMVVAVLKEKALGGE